MRHILRAGCTLAAGPRQLSSRRETSHLTTLPSSPLTHYGHGSPGPSRRRSALPRCQMAADQSVFVPDQSHQDNIEDRQQYEAEAVRVREAVELVDDEEAKDDERNRIAPELISKQTDDEEHFNDAVAEEIEGIEALGADGKILR